MKLRKSLLSVLLALILLTSMMPIASATGKTVTITVDAGITDASLSIIPHEVSAITLTLPAAGSYDYILTVPKGFNAGLVIFLDFTTIDDSTTITVENCTIINHTYKPALKQLYFSTNDLFATEAPAIRLSTPARHTVTYAADKVLIDGAETTLAGSAFTLSDLPAPTSYLVGSEVTLAAVPTLTGSDAAFIGWVDQSGDAYNAGGTLGSIQSDCTLTASFANAYSVQFIQGGPIESRQSSFNASISLPQPSVATDFVGWKCDADNLFYDAGADYTMPARNVTFTAVHKIPTSYEFDFEGQPITQADQGRFLAATPTGKKTYEEFIIPAEAPQTTKNWLHFRGWKLDWQDVLTPGNNVSGATEGAGPHKITPVLATTLLYNKGLVSETIADFVDGMPTPAELRVILDGMTTEKLTIPATAPTRSGFTFGGWRYNVDNELYQTGEEGPAKPTLAQLLALDAQPTLTAVWIAPGTGQAPGPVAAVGMAYYPDYGIAPNAAPPSDAISPKMGDIAPMAGTMLTLALAALALAALLIAHRRAKA